MTAVSPPGAAATGPSGADLVACATAFAEHLGGELVPACDAAAVRAAGRRRAGGHRRAAGAAGPARQRAHPSRRAVRGQRHRCAGRPAPALRYVADLGSAAPFFGPRLAAQRRVVDDLVARLGASGAAVGDEAHAFLDTVFPDPAVVAARTRAAAFVGVVHQPGVAAGPGWLKVYGNLGGDRRALARLSGPWVPFAEVAALVDDLPVVPRLTALGLAASGARRHKVSHRPREDDPRAPPAVLDRFGVAAGDVNTRIDIRGQVAEISPTQRGMFGDGTIGATAVNTGHPVITADKKFATVLESMGVEVRRPSTRAACGSTRTATASTTTSTTASTSCADTPAGRLGRLRRCARVSALPGAPGRHVGVAELADALG